MAQISDRNWTIKNSPYGTSHTSKLRYKIVGSKLVPVVEDDVYPAPVSGREMYVDPHSREPRPIAEKPNHVWPSQMEPLSPEDDPSYRAPPKNEKFYDAISHISKPQNDPLHPFSVLPPVRPDPNYLNPGDEPRNQPRNQPYDTMLQEMMRRIPGSRLPSEPVRFAPNEVSFLMNRLHQELEGFVTQRLKDIYVEMTSFDRKLSGLIHFDDFVFAARKHQLKCDPAILRLVAAMFVVPSAPNFVNYEKILSFIGAAMKSDFSSNYNVNYQQQQPDRRALDPRGMPHVEPHEGWNLTPRSIGLKTANNAAAERANDAPMPEQTEAQSEEPQQPSQHQPLHGGGSESPFKDRRRLEVEGNQAKLLSILHEALKDYTREDFNRLVDAFYLWDREKKGTLTVDDIKTVSYRQNLRVTNSVINALLDMCYVRWDQYDWRKFVKYVEAALPSTIGEEPIAIKPAPRGGMASENLRESLTHPGPAREPPPEARGPAGPAPAPNVKYSPRSGATSPTSDAARAWFDRFMRLSKALYTVDSKYVGHLPPDDVRWITNEYNRVYELGLHEADVEEAVNISSTHSGLINLDSYLRSLSLRGHH